MDIAAAIDEGMHGWMTRRAQTVRAAEPSPDDTACSVIVVSDTAVDAIVDVCGRWDLHVRVRAAQQPGWHVAIVTGRELPATAIGDVVVALRELLRPAA